MFQGLGNRFMNSLLEDNLQQNIELQEDSWLWSADSDGEDTEVDAPTLEQRASLASTAPPTPVSTVRKPSASDSLPVKEKYIHSKYVNRAYLVSTGLGAAQIQEELWNAVDQMRLQVRCIWTFLCAFTSMS